MLDPASPEALSLPQRADPRDAMRRQLIEAPLTQEQYEAVKGFWLRSTRPQAWRNVLILMLLRNTGFRPAELVRPQKDRPRRHFHHDAALRAGQVVQHGPLYWVDVLRAKKRLRPDYEPVILNPALGQPLLEYIRGNRLGPADPLFPINTRMLANIWYAGCRAALGYLKEPTALRDLYVTTVARLAREIVGYGPQDVAIASKMLGHTEVRTTRTFYEKLTPEQRRAIQERIPV